MVLQVRRQRRWAAAAAAAAAAPLGRLNAALKQAPLPYFSIHQELKLLVDDAAVYKMIGPALVRQEPGEAAANVGKRLEFIGGARLGCQVSAL